MKTFLVSNVNLHPYTVEAIVPDALTLTIPKAMSWLAKPGRAAAQASVTPDGLKQILVFKKKFNPNDAEEKMLVQR